MSIHNSSILHKLNYAHKRVVFHGKDHVQIWHKGKLIWDRQEEQKEIFAFAPTRADAEWVSVKGVGTVRWLDGTVEGFRSGVGVQLKHESAFAAYPEVEVYGYLYGNGIDVQHVRSIKGKLEPTPSSIGPGKQFYLAYELKEIGYGLFYNNPQYEDFESCFATTGLERITGDPFANCVNAKNINYCFLNRGLREVPFGMFGDCVNLESCIGTFAGCEYITTAVPELWKNPSIKEHEACFRGCVNASNYDDIPDDWK